MSDLSRGFAVYSSNDNFIINTVKIYLSTNFYEDIVIVTTEKDDLLSNTIISSLNNQSRLFSTSFENYGNPEVQEYITGRNPNKLLMIVIDLYKMLGNRLDKRLDAIQVRQKAKSKIVIDPFPYYVNPWKIYFPYSLLNKNWLQYNHSYAIEGEWNKWKNGTRLSDPCDENLIVGSVKHCTFIDYEKYFSEPEVITQTTSYEIKKEYEKYKLGLFETEATPKALLHKLDKFVQELCPWRSIPIDLKKVYKADFKKIIKTDLKIDGYLLSEINSLIGHSNNLTSGFYKEQNNV